MIRKYKIERIIDKYLIENSRANYLDIIFEDMNKVLLKSIKKDNFILLKKYDDIMNIQYRLELNVISENTIRKIIQFIQSHNIKDRLYNESRYLLAQIMDK